MTLMSATPITNNTIILLLFFFSPKTLIGKKDGDNFKIKVKIRRKKSYTYEMI